ncbi:phosphoribosylglycinamide formyltransferase [uncultured Nocardioides sp.]|uniref:phosphoribosylglycinamide formyltransferase n=1 Tax=uncultured Nocardioides sp. TaxID=198441 RepID=UPI002602FCFB|nr:formyltransferase family protein [uncultured Nocardioides sp.]
MDGHAYDPEYEHDACGVGLVAALDGKPRREIVEMGIEALKNVWHRGAVDADGKTGDGAGIRVEVPQDFFREHVTRTGHNPTDDPICVGQIFLPRTDFAAQEAARTLVETEVLHFGFYIYGWRQPPVDVTVIGQKAKDTRPAIEQIMFRDGIGRSPEELERALYICRRRIERRAREAAIPSFYVCSLSHSSLIYKGMFLAEQVAAYEPDLVVLAGFMKLVGSAFLAAFGGRTVNTHPALSPSFPGMHGPRDALEYGVKVTGCTLFVVDEGVDTGVILAQSTVPVEDDDDVESLHERIKVAERGMLVDTVGRMAREGFRVEGRRGILGG